MRTAKEAAALAAKTLDSKKAQDLVVLEVAGITALTEYMILCTGTSDTHIRALCEETEKVLEDAGEHRYHREGYRGDTWVVLDFGGVMVHVFDAERRKFYDLERLWADAPMVDLSELLQES